MSCQLIPFSWFDINVVKRRLFPEKLTDTPDTHLEWPEDFDEDCSLSNSESNSTWLQECHVYLSPSREILVFANKSIVVILTSKWESQTKNNVSCKYVLLWSGSLQQEKTEEITSVICLPLASVGRSSHHGADWTCIVVGYTTGYVRFFTENGSLMVSEFFHEEPVLHIKCQSYQASTYPGELEHHEELLITYRSAVVSLNGFALFQTLRGCRSHLARVKANCGEVMKPPPLAYKKWGFMEQRIGLDEVGVLDCEVVGPSTPHTFDHLHQHHIISSQLSYVGSIKPRAPATSLVIATGSHPFVGFHYSIEGATRQVIYHDVARAVTDRLKETLSHTVSNWIFGAQNTQDKAAEERTTTEPADPMDCRFGLCDPLRKGDNIVMTQNRRLSAVTDNLGRIILIDNFKGIAVRIWKGYRDAHCGWMEVFEESLDQLPSSSSSGGTGDKRERSFSKPHVDSLSLRMAHFLIVHCPRSSLLQVLSVQKGSKIATIPMTKGSRLLYINHGIVGTNNVLHKKKRGYVESSCVIIEPNGLLKEVVVPFHFALSEESSEKVRDIHLIRRLKKALRNAGGNRAIVKGSGNDPNASEEICSLIRELKCDESLTLVLLTMSNHRHTTAPLFLSSINTILQRLETRVNKSHVPVLWSMCCQLRQLINLYAEAVVSFEGTIGSKIKKNSDAQTALKLKNDETMKILTNNLKLSEFEAKDLLNLVQIFWTSQGARHRAPAVTFEENIYLPLVDFLSCFDLITSEKNLGDIYRLEETGIRETSLPLPISLKSGLQEQDMGNLCRLLFYRCLTFKDIPNNWMSAIVSSGIEKKDLLSMAIHTWLQFGWEFLGDSIVEVLQRLMSNIKAVCYMSGSKELAEEEFCIHCLPWWEDLRNLLASWHSPFLALIGALVIRAVALNDMSCATKCPLPLQDEESHSPEEGKEGPKVIREDGWERVSVEGMTWDKLVRNLEDLAYLEAAVSWPLVKSPVTISLEMVTAKGRGCVSEMVAQWVLSCSTLFGSEHWGPTALVSFLQKSVENDCPEEKKESTAFEALGLLGLLKLRFPFSLSASTLLANVCWECARCFASHGDCSIPVLSGALCWLQSIPSSRIRRGVCGLLWTVHLEHRIKAGAQLLECYPFMDAIPERVMLNEVGLPSLVMLHHLFENAYKFLDIMTELAASVLDDDEEDEEEALRWEEEMWGPPEKQVLQQGEGGGGSTPPPLVELALLQPPLPPSLNLQRLTLYHQLCLILCLISRIHPKGPTGLCQPISQLFAVEERALLLSSEDSDIHVKRERNPVGPALITLRMSFVKKSISAVCRSVDYYENLSKELIGLVFKASEMFGLPMDNIRRHYVCELYSCGHDREAEELMATVVDKENLASQLLVIVCHRLKYYLDHSGDGDHRSEVMTTFSPASLARLNNQQSSYLVCKDIPMQSTEQLLSILIAYLHEESKLYSEALSILDAVRVLASQEY